jgi:hypothetical protein
MENDTDVIQERISKIGGIGADNGNPKTKTSYCSG